MSDPIMSTDKNGYYISVSKHTNDIETKYILSLFDYDTAENVLLIITDTDSKYKEALKRLTEIFMQLRSIESDYNHVKTALIDQAQKHYIYYSICD